jgi:hypothetical protein
MSDIHNASVEKQKVIRKLDVIIEIIKEKNKLALIKYVENIRNQLEHLPISKRFNRDLDSVINAHLSEDISPEDISYVKKLIKFLPPMLIEHRPLATSRFTGPPNHLAKKYVNRFVFSALYSIRSLEDLIQVASGLLYETNFEIFGWAGQIVGQEILKEIKEEAKKINSLVLRIASDHAFSGFNNAPTPHHLSSSNETEEHDDDIKKAVRTMCAEYFSLLNHTQYTEKTNQVSKDLFDYVTYNTDVLDLLGRIFTATEIKSFPSQLSINVLSLKKFYGDSEVDAAVDSMANSLYGIGQDFLREIYGSSNNSRELIKQVLYLIFLAWSNKREIPFTEDTSETKTEKELKGGIKTFIKKLIDIEDEYSFGPYTGLIITKAFFCHAYALSTEYTLIRSSAEEFKDGLWRTVGDNFSSVTNLREYAKGLRINDTVAYIRNHPGNALAKGAVGVAAVVGGVTYAPVLGLVGTGAVIVTGAMAALRTTSDAASERCKNDKLLLKLVEDMICRVKSPVSDGSPSEASRPLDSNNLRIH